MKKLIFFAAALLLAGIIYACGGGGGSGSISGATGTVPLYVTDDMGDYKQVLATLELVQLVHTGTNTSCDLLTESQSVDIANLQDVLQLLNTSVCPAGPYNRVHIEFSQAVGLTNANDVPADCVFDSYKDNVNANQPNVLVCDAGGTCSLDISGDIVVIADTVNPFALDFNLREFEVENFGAANCAVTIKVEPQNSDGIDNKMQAGYKNGVTGYVSDLDVNNDNFVLTAKKGDVFNVEYAGALYRDAIQPDLDGLLNFAQVNTLLARIFADSIDESGDQPITASTVFVKMKGVVSGLDEVNHLFNLTNAAKGITIAVDYADASAFAKVDGALAENVWVETKLFGRDSSYYFAHEVEVVDAAAPGTDD